MRLAHTGPHDHGLRGSLVAGSFHPAAARRRWRAHAVRQWGGRRQGLRVGRERGRGPVKGGPQTRGGASGAAKYHVHV